MATNTVKQYNADIAAFLDAVDTATTDLTGDIQFYIDTVARLQNSAGTFTAEDQADVDAMEARLATSKANLQALADKTPPAPPTA
jgi:hypothetical protein